MADCTDHKTRNPQPQQQQKDSSLLPSQDYSLEEPSVVVGNHFSRLCLDRSFNPSTTTSIPNSNQKPMKKRPPSDSPPISERRPKKEKLSLPPTPPLRRCISDSFNFNPIPPFHSLLDSSSKSPPNAVAVVVAPPQPPPPASTNNKPPSAASVSVNNNNINSKNTLRRTVSDPNPSPSPAPKTTSLASSSSSSSGGDDGTSPNSRRLRRIKNRVREMSLWFQKVLDDEDHDEEDDQQQQEVANDQNLCNYHSNSTSTEDDEAERKFEETMGVERMGEGLVIHFRCHCGVPYQFLVAGGNCYYKLM